MMDRNWAKQQQMTIRNSHHCSDQSWKHHHLTRPLLSIPLPLHVYSGNHNQSHHRKRRSINPNNITTPYWTTSTTVSNRIVMILDATANLGFRKTNLDCEYLSCNTTLWFGLLWFLLSLSQSKTCSLGGMWEERISSGKSRGSVWMWLWPTVCRWKVN